MRYLTVAATLTLWACSPKTDCRQASATCAEGFTCVEGVKGWTCQPSANEERTAAEPTTEATPEKAPEAAPQGLTEVERKRLRSEATMNIRKLFDSSVSYYSMDWATLTGEVRPRQFPSTTLLTPALPPRCKDGRPVPYDPSDGNWNAQTWQHLNFVIDEPHYYRYEYISTGTGRNAMFTARALGDLDCDGICRPSSASGPSTTTTTWSGELGSSWRTSLSSTVVG